MTDYLAVSAAVAAAKGKSTLLREVIAKKGNPRDSGYEIEKDQWYVEPRRAIDALLNVESFQKIIWDPACGGGNIPKACVAAGYAVASSDIVKRGYGGVCDFLTADHTRVPKTPFDIITNPPFSLAVEFALKAFELGAGKVAILQRTTWLEGERRYQSLFRLNHLKQIWQFRSRISMPPGGADIEPKGGAVAFAWFVFSQTHKASPTLGWLP